MKAIVINGSPGAGKNTITNELSELLRVQSVSHVVLDADELARAHPEVADLKWQAIAALWPVYSAIKNEHLIIPVTLDSRSDLDKLRHATQESSMSIVELTADLDTLKHRVVAREPNKFWQEKLIQLVQHYHDRDESMKFGDIKVSTDSQSAKDAALEIVEELGIRP